MNIIHSVKSTAFFPVGGEMEGPQRISDKIEKWLARIPGVGTYRAQEHRRETDKRLRLHLAAQLDQIREEVKKTVSELGGKGLLAPLVALDQLTAQMQRASNTIRFASYGYSGIFDLERVTEETLDQLYSFDLSLMDDIDEINAAVSRLHTDLPEDRLHEIIRTAMDLTASLENKFRSRDSLLFQPVQ
jgi:hypothetical protein